MAQISWFFQEDMVKKALQEYKTPEEYFQCIARMPVQSRMELQDRRLQAQVRRAAKIPMFQRLWRERGFDPEHFRGLEDLKKIPTYDINDIRDSIARFPPYGDYQGIYPGPDVRARIYFSGGTTGDPRPTVYTPWDRVVGGLLGARQYYAHGLRPGDVVMNAFAYSTHNGAFIMDASCWYWMNCPVITVSTGNVTSSAKQLELARDYGAVTIFTTSDYLLRLRRTADTMGLQPKDFNFRFFTVLGDARAVEAAWGVPSYGFYAFHEVHTVAAECEKQDGLHIFEDAFLVEVVDPESGAPLLDGEVGELVVTCLYKTGSPQIRLNTHDLAAIMPGDCSCGNRTRRITPLAGRSDTMVKLRGINIWPEAIGDALKRRFGKPVEYFCLAYTPDIQDQMRVFVVPPTVGDTAAQEQELFHTLKDHFGVRLELQIVRQEEMDLLTGCGTSAKLKRFLDARKLQAFPPEIQAVFRTESPQ